MANTKISALTSATTVAGTEVLPIVQSSATVKVSVANLTPGLGTITAAKGGTGQTSYAVGDLLYADTTTTLAKLADVATGNALISGGVGVAPSWGKVGLTTHVSGALPVANGGTNASSASITAFNNITGYSASGATGTTSTNLVFSAVPTFGTTIGVGGATAAASGAGITFPATQSASSDANTLDDYEEGTWTPTLDTIGGSATTNPTYSSQTGTYTKVGRFVMCSFSMTLATKGTKVAGPFPGLGGLPFIVGSTAPNSQAPFYVDSLGANWIWTSVQVRASNTNGYLIGNKAAATSTSYFDTGANYPDLTNTTTLSGVICYNT